MEKPDYKKLLEEIKANRQSLDACPRHTFGEMPNLSSKLRLKLKCQLCGGEMDVLEAAQYARGYEAAGGNPDEIITNFRGNDQTPVTCPQCKGVGGVEHYPDDWTDCDLCAGYGTLTRAEALAYLNEKKG